MGRLRCNYAACSGEKRDRIESSSGDKVQSKRYSGMLDCLFKLYRTQGLSSWYLGLDAKLLQAVLNAAFHISCYEELIQFFSLLPEIGACISNAASTIFSAALE